MSVKYPVVLTPDDDGIMLTFPDVPEAVSCVYDEKDIQKWGAECLGAAFEFYIETAKPIPVPSKDGAHFILLDNQIEVCGKPFQWDGHTWWETEG